MPILSEKILWTGAQENLCHNFFQKNRLQCELQMTRTKVCLNNIFVCELPSRSSHLPISAVPAGGIRPWWAYCFAQVLRHFHFWASATAARKPFI